MIVLAPKEPDDAKRETGDYGLKTGKCTQIVIEMVNKSKRGEVLVK